VSAEPSLADRLVRIVAFRLRAGLATDAAALTHDLVASLVEAGLVAPADAPALERDVLARLGGDTTPPVVTCSASPPSLWPPNHKLVNVTATVHVADAGSGPAGLTLVGATSSEPDNGTGDGDTTGDIAGWTIGTADTAGQLRAERSGNGPGRVYTLTYRGRDAAGNTATCAAKVTVPHDQGH
jgi:hypothetical protein